jgi:hypothetical protein
VTESREEIQWDSLTDDEQRVLTSAMENQQLSSLYRKWRPPEGTLPRGAADGRRPYAEALIPAAVALVKRGLVGVATGDPDFRLLSEDEALAAVSNVDNWWRYVLRPGVEDALDDYPVDRSEMVDVAWQSDFGLCQGYDFTLSEWHWPPRMPLIPRAGQ